MQETPLLASNALASWREPTHQAGSRTVTQHWLSHPRPGAGCVTRG
ncbi:hypothetical protein [Ktedonobacter sp. SOSP1-52]|nr:hypothetical protein [Ktedonobacter sp. SOSP1-52]